MASPARLTLSVAGIILVVASLAMFFFASGLNRWVPVGILGAGLLLIIGIAVVGYAETTPAVEPRRVVYDDTYVRPESERVVSARPAPRGREVVEETEETVGDAGTVLRPTTRRRVTRRREL